MIGVAQFFMLAFVTAFTPSAIPAAAENLDVKPGLWEIHMDASAPPTKVCYTAELLNGDFSDMPMPPGVECKNETKQSTARLRVVHSVCNGTFGIDGETRVDAPNSETMTMQSSSVMTIAGEPQTINASASYKWLQSDCGDIKPFDPKELMSQP